MIELPEVVNDIIVVYSMLPILIGAGISVYLMLKDDDDNYLFAVAVIVGSIITFVIAGLYVVPLGEEYNEQMEQIISSVDCEELDSISDERPQWKNQIIEEIITRCIPGEHTPELLESIRGND